MIGFALEGHEVDERADQAIVPRALCDRHVYG
jgi:hypothetical protein